MKLSDFWKYPLWFAALLTGAKSFRANPLIGSPILNRLGLHVIRMILAHAVMQVRWFLLSPLISKEDYLAFRRDGYLKIENFLPEATFRSLRRDVENCGGTARQMKQGDTLTQRILLDDTALKDTPKLREFVGNKRYQGLLRFVAGKNCDSLLYLHRIRNGAIDGGRDPQKNLHSDTFHPHMKAWFYLNDVDMETGPFNFVPGSHQLTWKRIKWEYRKSITAKNSPDGYSEKGSLRALPADLKALGLQDAVALAVPANTLVIGSPNGFHGRGNAATGTTRFEIWAYNRRTPFNPLPGAGSKIYGRMERALMQRLWTYLDGKNKKRGVPSTWHLIDKQKVTHDDPEQR